LGTESGRWKRRPRFGRRVYIRARGDLAPSVGLGEMRERSNRAVSKTVEPLAAPWVRIPLSPRVLFGEMTEWPKVHAWKACVLVRVPWVRIPLSPDNPFGVDVQVIRYGLLPNPARTGR
jgi:hypothetical protein